MALVAINLNIQVWQEETRIAEQIAFDEAAAEDEAERQAVLACNQLFYQIQDKEERIAGDVEAYAAGEGTVAARFLWKYSDLNERELKQLEDDYMRVWTLHTH